MQVLLFFCTEKIDWCTFQINIKYFFNSNLKFNFFHILVPFSIYFTLDLQDREGCGCSLNCSWGPWGSRWGRCAERSGPSRGPWRPGSPAEPRVHPAPRTAARSCEVACAAPSWGRPSDVCGPAARPRRRGTPTADITKHGHHVYWLGTTGFHTQCILMNSVWNSCRSTTVGRKHCKEKKPNSKQKHCKY